MLIAPHRELSDLMGAGRPYDKDAADHQSHKSQGQFQIVGNIEMAVAITPWLHRIRVPPSPAFQFSVLIKVPSRGKLELAGGADAAATHPTE